jgi:hypothetical protein
MNKSDWACAEVIVFSKVLSDAEAQVVEIPGVQVRVRLKFRNFAQIIMTNGFGFWDK